ncbi:hypothetical protein K8I61_07640 [bacterium]|nr:hypothetical protein [bacterium]
MARCDTCGNEYGGGFQVKWNGESFHFDSFECAIHRLAPICEACGVRIVGHGVQAGDRLFCCSNCAREVGVKGLADHIETDRTARPNA